MPSIAQIRAARALLDWSQSDLANHAKLSQTGIARIENGTNKPNSRTLEKITRAFDRSFVEFIEDGVRLAQDKLHIFSGEGSLRQLQDDIYHELCKIPDAEVLLLGINEILPEEKEDFEYTKMHIERMQQAGIQERIIVNETESNFIAPKSWYRKVPENFFSGHTVFVYNDKIALAVRDPYHKVILLDNILFAQTIKAFFEFVWANAKPVE